MIPFRTWNNQIDAVESGSMGSKLETAIVAMAKNFELEGVA
jgi:hypothetical protein